MVNSTGMALFLPLMLMFGFAMDTAKQTDSSGKRIARKTKQYTMDDLPKLPANISPDIHGSYHRFMQVYLKTVKRILKAVEIENYISQDRAISGPPEEPPRPKEERYVEERYVPSKQVKILQGQVQSQSPAAAGKGTPSKEQTALAKKQQSELVKLISTEKKQHAQVQRENAQQQEVEQELRFEEYECVKQEWDLEVRFYRKNQANLYNKFYDSFEDNAEAQSVIDIIDDDDIDCGSQVVSAVVEWLTRGSALDAKTDEVAYFKQQTEIFRRNSDIARCQNNEQLAKKLKALEHDLKEYRSIFRSIKSTTGNPSPETTYFSVDEQVELIRQILPGDVMWQMKLDDIAADRPAGQSFEAAAKAINRTLRVVLSKEQKMSVYSTNAASGSSNGIVAAPAFAPDGSQIDPLNTNTWTSKYWSDKKCYKCKVVGHGPGWQGCAMWTPGSSAAEKRGKGRGKGNSNSRGRGGGQSKGRGRGGKRSDYPRNADGTIDKSNLECKACNQKGHFKDDPECPNFNETQQGKYGRANVHAAVAEAQQRKVSSTAQQPQQQQQQQQFQQMPTQQNSYPQQMQMPQQALAMMPMNMQHQQVMQQPLAQYYQYPQQQVQQSMVMQHQLGGSQQAQGQMQIQQPVQQQQMQMAQAQVNAISSRKAALQQQYDQLQMQERQVMGGFVSMPSRQVPTSASQQIGQQRQVRYGSAEQQVAMPVSTMLNFDTKNSRMVNFDTKNSRSRENSNNQGQQGQGSQSYERWAANVVNTNTSQPTFGSDFTYPNHE
jgi:hypothetical protein